MRTCAIVSVVVLALWGDLVAAAVAVGGPVAAAESPVASVFELFPVESGANAQHGFAVALDSDLLAVDRPPAPPSSTPSDGGGASPPGFPGEPFPVDPPQLDLRFDLPR